MSLTASCDSVSQKRTLSSLLGELTAEPNGLFIHTLNTNVKITHYEIKNEISPLKVKRTVKKNFSLVPLLANQIFL